MEKDDEYYDLQNSLETKNLLLHQQIEQSESTLSHKLDEENKELKSLLNFISPKVNNFKSARVIGRTNQIFTNQIFIDAGFEWRMAGCSMCLAMNDDIAMDGERVASSTNRNFEGRQGRGARTHLMSPAMVAAAAIAGHLVDVRNFK